MSWDVEFDEAVFEWLTGLEEESFVQVRAALNVLRDRGPQLGRPLVDTVVGSRHKNMKELRPGSAGRSELRVLFAFDPERSAILLVGGDKAGRWQDWYRSAIPMADDRYDAHLEALRKRADGDAGRGEER
ncbi:type II toxin-antitoxin system RelE/ParE family toxin [Promicromonospora sp. MEB111]|uniref:type II toxin-antitoxin system RelE/ParE family toxin n=1 Tax=unclassified Promicromonospora TaxID=2647929 RepID=UPI00254FE385|nr:type II toxin-antitoxin system RelE/ParE family toxin [Promicromonospora sp. MEB111]